MVSAWWYIVLGAAISGLADYWMKLSGGFTRVWLGVAATALYAASVALWGFALKTLPLGTVYSVWTGLGLLAAVSVGIIFFAETLSLAKIGFIAMIVGGCIGLMLLKE